MFYRELEHPQYYSATRTEFTHALQFAHRRQVHRILDVGCGSGAFLDLARQDGFDVCGLEFNRAAAERARARGHTVFMEPLANLAGKSNLGRFDLITFFQVLEHLPTPVEVMKDATRFVVSEGHIAVAVPNAAGVIGLDPWDPYNWPPHHITRWRRQDLERLATQCNLRLVEIAGDRLEGPAIKYYWQTHNKLAPVLGIRPLRGGMLLPSVLSRIYRLSLLKVVFPNWGHSIYAYYQHVESPGAVAHITTESSTVRAG
ncbi:MAG: class I SAM-dependent methyltransferase [Verrucomicrobiia bacterium]